MASELTNMLHVQLFGANSQRSREKERSIRLSAMHVGNRLLTMVEQLPIRSFGALEAHPFGSSRSGRRIVLVWEKTDTDYFTPGAGAARVFSAVQDHLTKLLAS